MPLNLNASTLPQTMRGLVSIGSSGAPRFWATIWSDVLGSGPIDQSQKITVAARAMAERKTIGHLS